MAVELKKKTCKQHGTVDFIELPRLRIWACMACHRAGFYHDIVGQEIRARLQKAMTEQAAKMAKKFDDPLTVEDLNEAFDYKG